MAKPCFTCQFRQEDNYSVHIRCNNPVDALVKVVTKGKVANEQRQKASQILVDQFLEREKKIRVAVVVLWKSCGLYPLLYDGMIVVACANHVEGKPTEKISDSFDMVRALYGVPIVLTMSLGGST